MLCKSITLLLLILNKKMLYFNLKVKIFKILTPFRYVCNLKAYIFV